MLPRQGLNSIRGPGLGEAQIAIWAAANYIRVVVILAIVLPPALRADLETASHRKGGIKTAGTTKRELFNIVGHEPVQA